MERQAHSIPKKETGVVDTKITIFLVLVTLVLLGHTVYQALRIRAELTRLIAALKALENGEQSFEEVGQVFLNASGRIKANWQTFERQLLLRGNQHVRSCDAGDYFHSNEIVDPALWSEFIRHIPGMLTGLGIICTFFGMKNGLGKASEALKAVPSGSPTPGPGASGDGVAALQNMTAGLLHEIQPAVGLSLTAVACAIGFLLVERIISSASYSKLEHLQQALNATFPRLSESHLLHGIEQLSLQMCEQSEQTMNSLKGLNTDFAVMLERSMTNAMKPLVDWQTKQFESSHHTLTGAVSQMNTDLVSALEKIQDQAQDASNDALQGMVSSFQDSLVQNSQGQIQEMLRAIEGVAAVLQGQREAQDRFVLSMSERLQAEEDRYRRQQEETFNHSSETVRSATSSLERLLAGLDTPLTQFQNLSQNYNQQASNLESLGSQLQQTAESLRQGSQALASAVQESKVQRMQTEQSLALAAKQSDALAAYNRNIQDALTSLQEQTRQLNQMINDLGTQSQETYSRIRQDTEGFRNALTGSAQNFLGEVETVLSKGVRGLGGAIDELAQQVETLREMNGKSPS